MKNAHKTKKQLINELIELRKRVAELETSETEGKRAEEALGESEERLDRFMDFATDAFALFDSELNYIEINKAWLKMTGLRKNRVIGRNISKIVPNIKETGRYDKYMEVIKTGKPFSMDDVVRHPKFGDMHWAVKAYKVGDGLGIIAIDITEHKKTEQELRRYRERLEELEEGNTKQLEETIDELEAFAYSVSHDLRAPLRAMSGFAQALLEDYGKKFDADGKEYAERIVDASQQMDAMIEDLLSYSRLSRAEIKLSPVSLEQILKRLINQIEAKIKEKDVEVIVDSPLPDVSGHSTTLMQVISNLLMNAITFVAPGIKPKVRIWSEVHDGWIYLYVEDNGIGIAPEYQGKIFRIFERLHGIETYPGTGIGLAIVRKGMGRMGGKAGLESASGKGSKFWIELKKVNVKK